MAEIKTQPHAGDVDAFLASAPRSADAQRLRALMERVSGKRATMWGPGIVGFDRYHYRYASGHAGTMCRIGFSPRAAALTLYLSSDYPAREALLARLGKHKTGKGCIYVKALADVDAAVLEELVAASLAENRARYPD